MILYDGTRACDHVKNSPNTQRIAAESGQLVQVKVRGLLFDKDGTLFDHDHTWSGWVQAVLNQIAPDDADLKNRMLTACGFSPDTGKFVEGGIFVAGTSADLLECWKAHLPDLTMAELEHIGLQELEHVPIKPVCDLHELLNRFRRAGLALGIATNDYEQGALKQTQDAGVSDYFDLILGYDSGHVPKPDGAMVTAFCKHVGLAPDQVAMIGDSTHDLDAGRAAGAVTIGVLSGPANAQALAGADFVLPSIAELPTLLGLS